MITLAAITLHDRLRKDSTEGKIYISTSLCDSEASQTGEIMESLWRFDPPTESRYFKSPSKANHASKEANAVCEEFTEYFNKERFFHGNNVALELIFKMITIYFPWTLKGLS